ncbi:MAG: hypothetical protein NC485_13940 [Ruminococcus flavefaciens]|nr:hypothetical protein [Ruminococcus flavefaciens]MCM1061481.1 hypothetical protein [Eubacterium sp.]
MDIFEYWSILHDAVVWNRSITEEGREYLENAYMYMQKKPDREMAGSKIKGINIKIGADTTSLDKALNGIESKSKTTRSELVEVNRSLKNNKDSVVLWEQKQQLLSKAFETSKEKLNMLESAQEQVNKQFQNKKITGEQYRAFQREVENAKSEVNRFGGQLEETENKIKDLKSTADKTSDSAENLGDELHEAGEQAENASSGGISVMTVALGNLVADGLKKSRYRT